MEHFFRERHVTIMIVTGSIVLLAILYFSYRNTRDLIDTAHLIGETHEVLLESDRLAMEVKNIQVDGRVYLVTKDESMLKLIANSETSARTHIQKLRQLVSDNPLQVVKIDSLSDLLAQHTNISALVSGRPDINELFIESKAYEDLFLKTLSKFQDEEYRVLGVRKAMSTASESGFEKFLVGLVAVFAVLMILTFISTWNGNQLRKRVTEQNETLKKSLRENMEYKYALDESAIVAITDNRGIIRHVNDNFCKISKYSRHELIGQDHRIINSGYHSKDFFAGLWRTISSGRVWKGELRNKAKDGSFYWVDTSIVPLVNESGKPYQYLAIRSDITERKVAEDVRAANRRLGAEIADKNAQLADLLDRINDGFVTLDENFNYTYANNRAGEMIHKDPQWMIGRNIWEIFPAAIGSPTYIALTDAMREQRYASAMDYYPPLDLWYENHAYPNDEGLSVFTRDVTRQMRAEQKTLETARMYRLIASSIPGSVICILDRDYRYVLVEGDLIDKLGYTKGSVYQKKAIDVLTPDHYYEMSNYFQRAFDGETFSAAIRRGEYDLLTRYVPIRDEHGNVTMIMVASMDVTPLKEAERRVAELNQGLEKKIEERTAQLEFANKELESFSYSVAHDLRSPLRAITGYANMLIEDYSAKLDPEANRLLSSIESNGHRMHTLIDDLLMFSKLGRKEIRRSVVNMKDVIEDVLKLLDVSKVRLNIEKIHPVYGDASLLRHVMTNLLSNAVKYSAREQQPEITIASIQGDNQVTYSITDNGVGFNMKHAENLFGVFKRLHTAEEFEGNGVGLAIVQRIVSRHGGKVWAYSRQGEGATFFFTLPAIPFDQLK